MNCRSAESLFSALIEDELSQKERRGLEAHLLGCRRCSAGVRELRATLALVRSVPAIETSPHFEDDVYARIRSGEALRPSVRDWVNGLLAPIRIRPLVTVGAGLCAIAFAVVMVVHPTLPGSTSRAPTASLPTASVAPSPAAPAQPDLAALTRSPGPTAPGTLNRSATELAGVTSRTRNPAATDSASDLARPEAGYQDEYIMDQFLLERAPAGRDPSMVPVSGSQGDDVYIEF